MEAYNVPSFGSTSRRRKGCVLDTQDIKASTDPYDPFQDFTRGEMAAYTSSATGTKPVPTKPMGQAPPTNPYANPFRSPVEGRFGSVPNAFKPIEGFQGSTVGGSSTPNTSTNQASGESRGPVLPKYYSGYSQDRKYYCDSYNICPDASGAGIEGFQGMETKNGSGNVASGGEPTPKSATCTGPLIAPNYEYPMTDEARRQYDRALQLSLNGGMNANPSGDTPLEDPATFIRAGGSSADVMGYTDADLESFLRTEDLTSAPFKIPVVPKDDRPVGGRDPNESPFAETMKNFTGPDGTPQLRPGSVDKAATEGAGTAAGSGGMSGALGSSASVRDPWSRVWEMALFVVAGLLLVLLLDQLFKLAMLYGMKRAFLAIEPLLERAAKASD
jgi:hypothetical protein